MFSTAPFNPRRRPEAGARQYVYLEERIILAVNIALVTHRPLLVTGEPGSGKSTLARNVARELRWAYVDTVITSRTRLDDLIASVDLVRRLSDAQGSNSLRPYHDYLVPGVLWWAVDPQGAATVRAVKMEDPRMNPQNADRGAVLLLDEIDKAEPDLPNDLLEPLDGLHLRIPFIGERSPRSDVLIVITSNRERDMPPAFLRRCIQLDLHDQDQAFLEAVAESHFGPRKDDLYEAVARRTLELRKLARDANQRLPSTAEFLDTVRACDEFNERPGSPNWSAIEEAALRKASESASGDE